MMIDATVLRARAWLQAGGSKQALADAAELHRNSLIDIDDPNWSPTFKTVRKIASGLDRLERSA